METKTLALYLGCDVNNGEWQLIGITSTHEGLQCPLIKDKHRDYVCSVPFSDCKLRLRRLSSMTEEEAKEYAGTFFKDYDSSLTKFYNLGHSIAIRYYDAFLHLPGEYEPKQFQWLLSKCFDLFGLIEKGEAIDSTNPTSPQP